MVKIHDEKGFTIAHPYDRKLFDQYKDTHYVTARVYLPEEGIGRQFDAGIVSASDEAIVVRTGSVEGPVRDYSVPVSCVRYMCVGRELEVK